MPISLNAVEKRTYPYPDYKFMTTLFSDSRLPLPGELINNARNFDRDRMQLFDERKAFDGILEEKMFSFFSNSYLAVLGSRPKTDYIRYSNDRAPQYQVSTEIFREKDQSFVKKHALSNESIPHIQKMAVSAKALEQRYDSEKLRVNPVTALEKISVTFPFEQGRVLSELFDECLKKEDMEGFQALFDEYMSRIDYHNEMPIADYDLAFSNILVAGDVWTLIDYEWTYEKAVPTKEIAFRALYCYLLEDEKRNKYNYDLILQKIGITQETAADYREQEMKFQKEVTGKRMSMPQLRELIGGEIIVPQKSLMKEEMTGQKNQVQVYVDTGSGFCEEDSYFVKEAYDSEGSISFTVSVPPEAKNIRIDPCMYSCMLVLKEVALNGTSLMTLSGKRLQTNGKLLKGNQLHEHRLSGETENELAVVFATQDPNLTIQVGNLVRSTGNQLQLSMEITSVAENMAQMLIKELKRKIRL